MKKAHLLTIVILGVMTTFNLAAQHQVEVTIKNVQELKGTIRVSLFNNDQDFLKKAMESKTASASASGATVVFNVKPGTYAVSVIHDVNDNKELDKGFMGIPQEPYGFSNDARGKFGPPSYESSKFAVAGDVKISIKVE
jgi:uncharacterized protein (DUF2141 family)